MENIGAIDYTLNLLKKELVSVERILQYSEILENKGKSLVEERDILKEAIKKVETLL